MVLSRSQRGHSKKNRLHFAPVRIRQFQTRRKHGATSISSSVVGTAFPFPEREGRGAKKERSQDHDEKCLGLRSSHQGCVSLSAWARARGSRPLGSHFPSRLSHLLDAQIHCECRCARRLATAQRNV